MGTFTAQILVGQGHPYHGGILVSRQLFLSENERPAWLLYGTGAVSRPIAAWVPTIEDMLEDGLLLLGVHVLRCTQLKAGLRQDPARLECYGLDPAQRLSLHALCRNADWRDLKIVVSVLEGSSVLAQLEVLREYPVAREVCVSDGRWFSRRD